MAEARRPASPNLPPTINKMANSLLNFVREPAADARRRPKPRIYLFIPTQCKHLLSASTRKKRLFHPKLCHIIPIYCTQTDNKYDISKQ